jgi:lysophospholipase L1-like esterase
LQDWGDTRVRYYDGLALFPEDQVDAFMPDKLHPNGDGYELMGRNIADRVLADLESM